MSAQRSKIKKILPLGSVSLRRHFIIFVSLGAPAQTPARGAWGAAAPQAEGSGGREPPMEKINKKQIFLFQAIVRGGSSPQDSVGWGAAATTDFCRVDRPGGSSRSYMEIGLAQSAFARCGFSRAGFSDLMENRSFWGSGWLRAAQKPFKKVGGFAPYLFTGEAGLSSSRPSARPWKALAAHFSGRTGQIFVPVRLGSTFFGREGLAVHFF